MKPQCTWQDPPDKRCPLEGNHDHKDNMGVVWASLCDQHQAEFNDAYDETKPADVPLMLRCYVRAGGGAKKMAGRIA